MPSRLRHVHLNEKDEKVLACAQLNADASVIELAKLSGVTVPTVRRTISRLTDIGAIKRFWYIDVYALGYTLYNVWFTLAAPKASQWNQLIEFLIKSPAVVFFTETAGRYNYSLTIQTATLTEYQEFMEILGAEFGGCFLEKTTATVISLTDLPLIRSFRNEKCNESIKIGVHSKKVNVDKLDLSIISALVSDPNASILSISRQLGQPSNTINYRFNQLIKNRVISGCRYFIDYLQLGSSFVYHQIAIAGMNQTETLKLVKYLSNHRFVYYVEQTIGPWDLEVGTVINQPQDLTIFSRELCNKFGKYIAKLESVSICGFFKLHGSPYR